MENNDSRDIDYSFKLVIIGDSTVGKSSIRSRFTKNEFCQSMPSTHGFKNDYKIVDIDSKVVKAEIWDTAGQDQYRGILPSFYRGVKGALVVFDITNRESFKALSKWIRELKLMGDSLLSVLLIGNKNDLENERKVSQEEATIYAQKNQLLYMETSALTAENVDKAFQDVLTDILRSTVVMMAGGEKPMIGPTKKITSSEKQKMSKQLAMDAPRCACACICRIF